MMNNQISKLTLIIGLIVLFVTGSAIAERNFNQHVKVVKPNTSKTPPKNVTADDILTKVEFNEAVNNSSLTQNSKEILIGAFSEISLQYSNQLTCFDKNKTIYLVGEAYYRTENKNNVIYVSHKLLYYKDKKYRAAFIARECYRYWLIKRGYPEGLESEGVGYWISSKISPNKFPYETYINEALRKNNGKMSAETAREIVRQVREVPNHAFISFSEDAVLK
ncbi:MAG: hypothetical protein HQM10_22900 [Candidatus Riflebacteria bacterium]|nr:hypothetical protein [Candidatus Riflebacteria bacterium]MBF0410212.1 hypothetical protein [Candidatus Riflebacteria bacterium]